MPNSQHGEPEKVDLFEELKHLFCFGKIALFSLCKQILGPGCSKKA